MNAYRQYSPTSEFQTTIPPGFSFNSQNPLDLNSILPVRKPNSQFFEFSSDIWGSGEKQAVLLDVGDFYILHFDKQLQPEDLKTVVILLYECLGESPSFIPLNICVSQKQQKFITKTVGRIFQKETDVGKNIIDRPRSDDNIDSVPLSVPAFIQSAVPLSVPVPIQLVNDIKTMTAYYDVAQRHKKLDEFIESPIAKPPSPWINPSNFKAELPSQSLPDNNIPGITGPTVFEELSDQRAIDAGVATGHWQALNDAPKKAEETIHIIYNDLFHIGLIFETVCQKKCVIELCNEFPEFTMVRKLHGLNDKLKICNDIFHCKTFEHIDDLNKKIDNFVNLYDIQQNEEELPRMKNVDKVRGVLHTYFILSDDPASRMRASDLIDMICQRVNDSADSNFRKHLPGYLIECGLRKKRLRDGNHYWGIKTKDAEDVGPLESISMEKIVEQRKQDLENCSKYRN